MKQDDKLARLKRMLAQAAPVENDIESIATALPEADDVAESPAAAESRRMQASALGKVETGREGELTPQETFSLEAIILPELRPVAFIVDGKWLDVKAPWTHLNAPAVRERLEPRIPAIGRIELPNNPFIPYGGTGFVVGPDLMFTNRHVAELFAEGIGTRLNYRPGDAAVDFKREKGDRNPPAPIMVQRVEMIHPFWDMALLRVSGLEGKVEPLALSVTPPEEMIDRDVVVIGYPARDERNDLKVQDWVFEQQYQVKRFQPGKLRTRGTILSFENRVDAITHDSSTLGGNSGSCVIDVGSGLVVGLHFGGRYLKANYAVPMYELARDRRVAGLGLNFAGSVPPTDSYDRAWALAGGGEAPRGGDGVTTVVTPGTNGTTSVTVQVTIGAPQANGVPATAADEAMKIPIIHPNLEERDGYKEQFIGNGSVPAPKLTKEGRKAAAKLDDDSIELKYHKFSIVMHAQRRLALFTAANVDWRMAHRLIKGKKPSRKQLTGLKDNDREKWAVDPRLPADAQLPDVFYTRDGGAFDKGHLVRRDDVAWGKTFSDMQKANGDTYHTTNCSPQVGEFNQSSRGEENWGDLETLVQQQTRSERACVFSGPVLEVDDPIFDGKDVGGGTIRLRIPRRFWKIIVVKEGEAAGAYGFVLEQDLSGVPTAEEFAVPSEWRPHMERISRIEGMLGGLIDLSWHAERDRYDSAGGEDINEALK